MHGNIIAGLVVGCYAAWGCHVLFMLMMNPENRKFMRQYSELHGPATAAAMLALFYVICATLWPALYIWAGIKDE